MSAETIESPLSGGTASTVADSLVRILSFSLGPYVCAQVSSYSTRPRASTTCTPMSDDAEDADRAYSRTSSLQPFFSWYSLESVSAVDCARRCMFSRV